MRQWVILLSFENFYLTAERNFDPRLHAKAAVVVQGKRILDISPEAKKVGIHQKLSSTHLRSVPGILILPYREEHYLPLYHQIWNIVANHTPTVEPIDFHEGFMQIGERANLRNWLLNLKEELFESTGLRTRVGGGPNKLIARLSAQWEMLIPEKEVSHLLLSISLECIDWIDYRVIERLYRLGISTIGEIKTIPKSLLGREFPDVSDLLIQLGRGEDPNPVIPIYPPEREEKIVELEGESDYRVLTEYLSLCAEELSATIRSQGKEALELELIFSEGKKKERINKKLIRPINSSDEILRISSALLRGAWQGGEIYTMRVILSQLRHRNRDQLNLLHLRRKVNSSQESSERETVQRITKKYGNSIIGFRKRRRRMAELIFEKKGRYLL